MPSNLTVTYTSDDGNRVDTLSPAYRSMLPAWQLVRTLSGGTSAMREAGKTFLPQEEGEKNEEYATRRDRTYLYEAYDDSVEKLADKPFRKRGVTVENLPPRLAPLEINADRRGNTLTAFMRSWLQLSIHRGLAHVFVDHPDSGGPASYPYFTLIDPMALIGWREEIDETGETRLLQIRWVDYRLEEKGAYGAEVVPYIRVVSAPGANDEVAEGTFELWRAAEPESFILGGQNSWKRWDAETGEEIDAATVQTHTFPGIPLVTHYTRRLGFLQGQPALEKLAWLNLEHWVSSSEQRNALHTARVPILLQTGVDTNALEKDLEIGSRRVVRMTAPDGNLRYVSSGDAAPAIQEGAKDIQAIEARMTVLGLQPLVEITQGQTATGRQIDEDRSHSSAQTWARDSAREGDRAIGFAQLWLNPTAVPVDAGMDVDSDFGVSDQTSEIVRTLQEDVDAVQPRITLRTYWEALIRQGYLPEGFDMEREAEALGLNLDGEAVATPTRRVPPASSSAAPTAEEVAEAPGREAEAPA